MAGYARFPGGGNVSERSSGNDGMVHEKRRLIGMAIGTYFPERKFFGFFDKEAVMDIMACSAGTLVICPPCTGAVQRLAICLGLYFMYLTIDDHCLGRAGAGR